MAVRTREEIMSSINERYKDDTTDEALSFIEDMTDTLNDYESKIKGDGTDWKKKYEDNDKEWREKYRDRFFNNSNIPDDTTTKIIEEEKIEETEPKTFEDLFKIKEDNNNG